MDLSQKITQMIDLPPSVILAEREKFENWYIQTMGAKESDKEFFFATFGEPKRDNPKIIYYINDYFNKLFCAWLMGVQLSGSAEKENDNS